MKPEPRAAVIVGAAGAAAGALSGVVWGVLAPAQRSEVRSDGTFAALTSQSAHRFDAVALFACFGLVVGAVAAAASWLWRSNRGPVVLGGLIAGSALGSLLAALIGNLLTNVRFGSGDVPAPRHIVALAPQLDLASEWQLLLMQPLAACVVYVVTAVFNPHDDLGSGRSYVRAAGAPGEVTAADPAPPLPFIADSAGWTQRGKFVGDP